MGDAGVLPLSLMEMGERAEVVELIGERETKWRLMDLGLVPGTRVEVVRSSPLGDPILYRFRGTTVALRRVDAEVVRVRQMIREERKEQTLHEPLH